jgi:hypothetical protein
MYKLSYVAVHFKNKEKILGDMRAVCKANPVNCENMNI